MVSFQYPAVLWLIPVAVLAIFFLMRANMVRFRSRKERREFTQQKKAMRAIVFITRSITFALLLIALSGPIMTQTKTVQGNPELLILVDHSDSYALYDLVKVAQLERAIGDSIPVTTRTIATGNSSAIGDALLHNIQGDDSVLLVSDGYATQGRSLGDIMFFASRLNTTINVLSLPLVHSDAVVAVEGPQETTRGVETDFFANVDAAGALAYQLTVDVDGVRVLDEPHSGSVTVPFSYRFGEGYHRIEARIRANDFYEENNVYYKSVKVEPRPKVLLVTREKSPLEQVYGELYELSVMSSVPGSLSLYTTVILNDLPANQIPVDRLASYVAEGNGLVVIGGTASYDKGNYKNAPVESLLPAAVGTGVEDKAREDVNVVLLIDVSGTAGAIVNPKTGTTVEDVEKALALQIINDLSLDSNVAVVAFSSSPYVVGNLLPVRQHKSKLTEDIVRLKFGGGTVIEEAFAKGRELLLSAEGSKNIILISDGLGGNQGEELRQVRLNNLRGIKLYTVGVGPHTNSVHMSQLAELGNGVYFEPSESQRIRLLFGDLEEEKDQVYRLTVLDGGDFITRNLRLNAVVNGFNFVVPKSAAKTLITTSQGHPIALSWRFGLGRVATLATDDGAGWASQLLNRENAGIHSRMVNWAVGDLGRNKPFDVKMKDGNLGEPIEITVRSSGKPVAQGITFTQVDENLYTGQVETLSQGFSEYLGGVVAVNYPVELAHVGISPELSQLVSVTNGRVFTADEPENIVEKVVRDSRRIDTVPVNLRTMFVVAALFLFLLEVLLRKIDENRNINK